MDAEQLPSHSEKEPSPSPPSIDHNYATKTHILEATSANSFSASSSGNGYTGSFSSQKQHKPRCPSPPPLVTSPSSRSASPYPNPYVVQSVDDLTQSPHTLALIFLLIFTCMLLFVLDVVADVFQLAPAFPTLPIVVTSSGLTVFSLAVTVALGTHILPDFHMFSPLAGGEQFFAMQMGGYALSIGAMVLKVLLVLESAGRPRYGGLTVLGVTAVAGHVLLITSFLYFVMPQRVSASAVDMWNHHLQQQQLVSAQSVEINHDGEKNASSSAVLRHVMRILTPVPAPLPENEEQPGSSGRFAASYPKTVVESHRDIAVATALFGTLLLSTSVATSWSSSTVAAVLHFVSLTSFLTTSFAVLRLRAERMETTGSVLAAASESALGSKGLVKEEVYKAFRSYQGSMVGALAQMSSHIFLGFVLFSVTRVFLIGVHSEESTLWKISSTVAASGCIGIHSVLLYVNVRHHANESEKAGRHSTRASSPLPDGVDADLAAAHKSAAMREPFLVTVTAAYLYFIVQGLFIFLYWKRDVVFSTPLTLAHYRVSGVLQLQAMFTLLLFMMPPLTHCQGRLIFGPSFGLWNPFGGNGEFLLAQSVSWSSFGSAVLAFTFHLAAPKRIHLFLISTFLLLAQIGIFVSLHYFNPKKSATFSLTTSYSGKALAAMSNSQRTSIVIRTVFNGELILALVFAATALVLRTLCDVAGLLLPFSTASSASSSASFSLFTLRPDTLLASVDSEMGTTLSFLTPTTMLQISYIFSLLAVPMAQFSMRHHVRLLYDLDQRSTGYVLLITIGWTTYVGGGLVGFTRLLLGGSISPLDSLHTPSFPFFYTCEGLVLLVPLVCLICGFVFEINKVLRSMIHTDELTGAVEKLTHWVEENVLSVRSSHNEEGERQQQKQFSALISELQALIGNQPTKAKQKSGVAHEMKRRDAEAVRDAAYYITVLTSIGSTSIFTMAALLVGANPVIPSIFGISGLMVVTLACGLLQYSYGHRLHEGVPKHKAYHFFMPFRGGKAFIFLQGIGWSAFTLCWFLMIATSIEGKPSVGNFLVVAVTSALSQVIIMISIGYFDENKSSPSGYVARSPEGLLAAATITGTFFAARLYEAASASRLRTGDTVFFSSSNTGYGFLGGSSPVSVVLCALSFCVAVPMGLSAIQRQTRQAQFSPLQKKEVGDDGLSFEGGPAVPAEEEEEYEYEMDEERAEVIPHHLYGGGREASEEDDGLEGKPMQQAIWLAFSPPGARRELIPTPSPVTKAPPLGDAEGSGDGQWPDSTMARTSTEPAIAAGRGTEEGGARRGFGKPHWPRMSRRNQRYFVSSLSRVLALLLVYLVPFIVFFLVYTYRIHHTTFRIGVMALESVGMSLAFLLALPTLIPVLLWSSFPKQLYYYLCAWFMWSVPTITVVSGLSPPFIVNTWGAWLWFCNMTIMCCFSTIPRLSLIAFIVNSAMLGIFLSYHVLTCWYLERGPFILWRCLADVVAASLWTWYDTRYFGKPHITGRLYSPRFRWFFKNYIFYGSMRYFNMRVIRAEPYVLEDELVHMGEQGPEGPVDRRDPSRQYLFSFHPHGVFPGSSLYVPCTQEWEDVIGRNDVNIITTHAADVIFVCPFMREIPICVGALSVARKGIEASIAKGHSPLIITGGQSEMLLTKWSDTEMHFVCHHLGFIKMAMRHKIPLVPVISFSECNIMDNVHFPKIQRWFVKRLGFPGIVLPHGFWYLPLPTHRSMALVVGHPIRPYPGRDNPDDPSCVEEMRARYFRHLQTVFYRYRAEAGYPDMVLYLHNGIFDAGTRIPPPEELSSSKKED